MGAVTLQFCNVFISQIIFLSTARSIFKGYNYISGKIIGGKTQH
jgi:hypothetical protein